MAAAPIPYSEIVLQTTRISAPCALALWITNGVAVWPDGHKVAVVAIATLASVAYNVTSNHLAARGSKHIEVWRAIANIATLNLVCWLADWPLPMWFWLPFTGFIFDIESGRYTLTSTLITIAILDVHGLYAGQPWQYPAAASVFTVFAMLLARARVITIRDMLGRSEQQRAEIEQAHQQLVAEVAARERMELELHHAQKLEALGRIASGVAHEINTPIQFVGDSISFVQAGVSDVLSLCKLNESARTASGDARAGAIAAAAEAEVEADLPYLIDNLPQALARARDGVDRVALIVRSMKQFAHPDVGMRAFADLNKAIEATLTITRHEYKLVADLETELGDVPPVSCNVSEINQVLLNLVVNAAHAIDPGATASGRRGTIRVATRRDGTEVVISVADTGTGIPIEVRDHIFDPFFTTKEVGRGTGQGLAIARAIVDNHGGKLTFDTELGHGTTFYIRLPIGEAAALRLVS